MCKITTSSERYSDVLSGEQWCFSASFQWTQFTISLCVCVFSGVFSRLNSPGCVPDGLGLLLCLVIKTNDTEPVLSSWELTWDKNIQELGELPTLINDRSVHVQGREKLLHVVPTFIKVSCWWPLKVYLKGENSLFGGFQALTVKLGTLSRNSSISLPCLRKTLPTFCALTWTMGQLSWGLWTPQPFISQSVNSVYEFGTFFL